VLPGRSDRDPLARERILPHGGSGRALVEHAGIRCTVGCKGRVGIVEVDELATVGETVFALGDLRHSTSSTCDSAWLPPIGWVDACANRRTVRTNNIARKATISSNHYRGRRGNSRLDR